MKIGVPNEQNAYEKRVALVPDFVQALVKKGFSVMVQAGAGEGTNFPDEAYRNAGAEIASEARALYELSEIVLRVSPLRKREAGLETVEIMRQGQVLVGFLDPYDEIEVIHLLAQKKVTAFAMELVPRISRAQSMDALSSQASVAGYKAVLLAANALGKFFPFLTTAAGTLRPARVLVIGAGVAGLQAIATAKRLGAEVFAFDIRPAVKEEVESLGAKFVEVPLEEKTEAEGGYAREVSEEARKKEQEVLSEHIAVSDVVITTAQVPGKRAPVLVTAEMVKRMRKGSVIVDVAAERGGNCELTEPGKDVVIDGIEIIGRINLPATVPIHASQMYSRNLTSFLELITKDGKLHLNFEDEIVRDTCVTHDGEIVSEKIRQLALRHQGA